MSAILCIFCRCPITLGGLAQLMVSMPSSSPKRPWVWHRSDCVDPFNVVLLSDLLFLRKSSSSTSVVSRSGQRRQTEKCQPRISWEIEAKVTRMPTQISQINNHLQLSETLPRKSNVTRASRRGCQYTSDVFYGDCLKLIYENDKWFHYLIKHVDEQCEQMLDNSP